jgi:hypothetical protein
MKKYHSKLNTQLIADFKAGLIAIDYTTIKDSMRLLTIFRAVYPITSIHWFDSDYYYTHKGLGVLMSADNPTSWRKIKTIDDFFS